MLYSVEEQWMDGVDAAKGGCLYKMKGVNNKGINQLRVQPATLSAILQ